MHTMSACWSSKVGRERGKWVEPALSHISPQASQARKQGLVGGHYELGGGERTGVDLFRLQFRHRARYRRGGDHFSKGKGDTVQDLIGSVLYREVSDSIGI